MVTPRTLFFPFAGDIEPAGVIIFFVFVALVASIVLVLRHLVRKNSQDARTPSRDNRWRRPPPLDATGWTLLVDGSNFSRRGDDSDNARLPHLQEVLDALRARFRNAQFVIYCDANLRYLFPQPERVEFTRLVDQPDSIFRETHEEKADWPLLRHARSENRCIVVSNDKFAEGRESALRKGVPLLKVYDKGRPIRLAPKVQIHTDGTRPRTMPVGILIRQQ